MARTASMVVPQCLAFDGFVADGAAELARCCVLYMRVLYAPSVALLAK